MLYGAQKLRPMFAEVERQGMPAVAMSDHGNMFGAYEFHQVSRGVDGVKPIIGIEAYAAPLEPQAGVLGPGGQRAMSDDGEGSVTSPAGWLVHADDDVGAERSGLLKNLSICRPRPVTPAEFPAGKPRMDMSSISEHAGGIIATTGCPSGAIQTRLRLNQYDEAREVAAAYQDIFGKESYFLELMDHGLSIEKDVRDGLLRLARDLSIPLLATNDAHYVHEDQADAHDNLLCIGVGKNKDDPKRFRFQGSGYYLKTAAEMRELFAERPGGLRRQHPSDRRARRVLRLRLRERRRDAAVPGRSGGGDAGVLAAQGMPQGPGHALRRPGPGRGHGALRDRDDGHRPDGLLLLLPRGRRHLPPRPRQRDPGRARPRVGHRLDRRVCDPHHRALPCSSTACSSNAF